MRFLAYSKTLSRWGLRESVDFTVGFVGRHLAVNARKCCGDDIKSKRGGDGLAAFEQARF